MEYVRFHPTLFTKLMDSYANEEVWMCEFVEIPMGGWYFHTTPVWCGVFFLYLDWSCNLCFFLIS